MSPASELRQSSCISWYPSQNYREWACNTSAAGEVDYLDVEDPSSMSQMDSSLKTTYFMLLSFPSLLASLCNGGCNRRSVSLLKLGSFSIIASIFAILLSCVLALRLPEQTSLSSP